MLHRNNKLKEAISCSVGWIGLSDCVTLSMFMPLYYTEKLNNPKYILFSFHRLSGYTSFDHQIVVNVNFQWKLDVALAFISDRSFCKKKFWKDYFVQDIWHRLQYMSAGLLDPVAEEWCAGTNDWGA